MLNKIKVNETFPIVLPIAQELLADYNESDDFVFIFNLANIDDELVEMFNNNPIQLSVTKLKGKLFVQFKTDSERHLGTIGLDLRNVGRKVIDEMFKDFTTKTFKFNLVLVDKYKNDVRAIRSFTPKDENFNTRFKEILYILAGKCPNDIVYNETVFDIYEEYTNEEIFELRNIEYCDY